MARHDFACRGPWASDPRARVGGLRSEVRCGCSNGNVAEDVWPSLMTGAVRWTISEMLLGTPTPLSATATYRARVRRELLPVACTLMLAPRFSRTRTRTRCIIVYVKSVRFWAEPDVVRKGQWRSKIGIGIGIGIEGTRNGIRTSETGCRNCVVAVLTNSAAKFDRCLKGPDALQYKNPLDSLDYLDDTDRLPDFDFDLDPDNDLTDRQPLVTAPVHVLAASSCTGTCTASLCTCTFLGKITVRADGDVGAPRETSPLISRPNVH